MKTMKFTKRVFSLLCIASLVFACSKEDGNDGATGAQGEQGIAGANGQDGVNGQDGAQGDQGETGTANVIYSDWIDSPLADDIASATANENITVASLSQEIVDQGAVLVYGRVGGSVYSLPYIGNQGVSYYYYHNLEIINLRLATIDGSNIGSPLFSTYRYVLIPGGTEASNGIGGIGSKSKTSATDYTKMSYKEVITAFNIPE